MGCKNLHNLDFLKPLKGLWGKNFSCKACKYRSRLNRFLPMELSTQIPGRKSWQTPARILISYLDRKQITLILGPKTPFHAIRISLPTQTPQRVPSPPLSTEHGFKFNYQVRHLVVLNILPHHVSTVWVNVHTRTDIQIEAILMVTGQALSGICRHFIMK